MKSCVIFDLDGCLSDDRWRRWRRGLKPIYELAPPAAYDYDTYHRASDRDIAMNVHFFKKMTEGALPVFITSRPPQFREKTEAWIRKNLDCGNFLIYMRASAETSPAFKAKVAKELLERFHVAAAFDDRKDVLKAYSELGISPCYVLDVSGRGARIHAEKKGKTAADALEEMARTFQERNSVYKDNYKKVGALVRTLFPEGVPRGLVEQDHWHLFELILVKLTRFTQSELQHKDSIHDIAVYAAMIQAELEEKE